MGYAGREGQYAPPSASAAPAAPKTPEEIAAEAARKGDPVGIGAWTKANKPAFDNPSDASRGAFKLGIDGTVERNPDGTPKVIVPISNRAIALNGSLAAPRIAPEAAHVQVAPVGYADRSALDTNFLVPGMAVTGKALDQQSQLRRQEQSNIRGRLTAAADGLAPSAAEGQLQLGLDAGMRQSLALAASNRGSASSGMLAGRQAIDANQQLAARTNAQAATLRAGEMAQARGDLTNALSTVRQQDLGGAQIGLGLTGQGVQAAGLQLGSDTQTRLANLGKDTTLATKQADVDQGKALSDLNSKLQQTGMDDQQRLAYLGASLGIDARTQQGMEQLATLATQFGIQVMGINAGSVASAQQANSNLVTGILSGGASLGAAAIS